MPRTTRLEEAVPEPLLNEVQRAALDAALAKKRLEGDEAHSLNGVPPELVAAVKPHLGKNPHTEGVKTKAQIAHDHHLSRRGKGNGRTKKGGAGGRFTWGMVADPSEVEADAAADRGDPNWDSTEEDATVDLVEARSTQIAAYRAAIVGLLHEFFNSGDVGEAATSLADLDRPEFGHYFVKKAVTAALDRHDREREMVSFLLSALYNELVSPEEMRRGFVELVSALDDLKLDVPDAVDLIATFMCRAVADDVLPPAFVHRIEGPPGSAAEALHAKAEAHLADQHFAERMGRAWGLGAGFRLEETKASVAAMLAEFFSSGDAGEVRRLLRDLAVPFFHHELVKQALVKGAVNSGCMERALSLLGQLAECGDVSTSQMTKGFQRLADSLADLQLDNPGAGGLFDAAVAAARQGNWLEEGWAPQPTPASAPSTPGGAAWSSSATAGPFHPSVTAFKAAVVDAVREYLESGDVEEVARRLTELDEPGFHNIAVKHAVALSMDRRDREREMVSALLPALCPGVIGEEQAALGFTRLLAAADDLALDIPEAAHLLALFVGRAVVDEVLAPKFLAEVVPSLPREGLGLEVVAAAGAMLSARHAAERFATCWHARGVSNGDTAQLAASIKTLLEEYSLGGGGVPEATQCLRDLGAPHFHHELVYQALVAAVGEPAAKGAAMARLLRELSESGEVSETQTRLGFDRVKATLEDLSLDVMGAPERLAELEKQAVEEKWLV